ncbi:hypothetical protein UlMin_034342 [Ulmus minor]
MRTYFRAQNLWKVVEERLTIPDDTSTLTVAQKKALDESIQKDCQALFALQQAMSEEIFLRIMGATTAKEAWDTLQEEFQGSKKVRVVKLQSFRRDFENLKMKDNETAKDYYSRIKELVNQMKAYGENITDKKIVEKILISCTEKYDSVISTIEESKDIETLTPTELMGSLEAHEKRINRRNENTNESAFSSKINMQSQKSKVGGRKIQENFKNKNQDKYFENKSNFPPCGICNKKSHLEKDCWFKPKPQCRNCKKYGHVEKDCRLKRNHQANFLEEKEGNYLFHVSQNINEEKKRYMASR